MASASASAVLGAFDRKTIPRIVFRTCLTAPKWHTDRSDPQVQGGGGSGNDPGDHFPDDAPTAITPSTSRRISCSRISRRAGQTRSGQATSPMSGRGRYETDKKTVRGTVFPSIGVYLAVIIDLFSRRVVALRVLHAKPFRVTAWAISNRMKQDLALRALNMAIAIRRPPPGCVHHTDRPSHGLHANRCRATGSQYCAQDHQKLCASTASRRQ